MLLELVLQYHVFSCWRRDGTKHLFSSNIYNFHLGGKRKGHSSTFGQTRKQSTNKHPFPYTAALSLYYFFKAAPLMIRHLSIDLPVKLIFLRTRLSVIDWDIDCRYIYLFTVQATRTRRVQYNKHREFNIINTESSI